MFTRERRGVDARAFGALTHRRRHSARGVRRRREARLALLAVTLAALAASSAATSAGSPTSCVTSRGARRVRGADARLGQRSGRRTRAPFRALPAGGTARADPPPSRTRGPARPRQPGGATRRRATELSARGGCVCLSGAARTDACQTDAKRSSTQATRERATSRRPGIADASEPRGQHRPRTPLDRVFEPHA